MCSEWLVWLRNMNAVRQGVPAATHAHCMPPAHATQLVAIHMLAQPMRRSHVIHLKAQQQNMCPVLEDTQWRAEANRQSHRADKLHLSRSAARRLDVFPEHPYCSKDAYLFILMLLLDAPFEDLLAVSCALPSLDRDSWEGPYHNPIKRALQDAPAFQCDKIGEPHGLQQLPYHYATPSSSGGGLGVFRLTCCHALSACVLDLADITSSRF
jgi:hypothetical protein